MNKGFIIILILFILPHRPLFNHALFRPHLNSSILLQFKFMFAITLTQSNMRNSGQFFLIFKFFEVFLNKQPSNRDLIGFISQIYPYPTKSVPRFGEITTKQVPTFVLQKKRLKNQFFCCCFFVVFFETAKSHKNILQLIQTALIRGM